MHAADSLTDITVDADSFIIGRIEPGCAVPGAFFGPSPTKFEGTLLMLVTGGDGLRVEINHDEYILPPGTIMMAHPGNTVRMLGKAPEDFSAYALYLGPNFMRGVNINLTALSVPQSIGKRSPVMAFTDEERALFVSYFNLITDALRASEAHPQVRRSIASNLTAALFYQLIIFFYRRLEGEIASEVKVGSRRNDYVREFIRLVHIHYISERSVGFYADRLYISPKYLSLLVKEATGRTAASWIDEFVLMEAKNMLRFSGKNIQQIAYALNFPTQSSFGKYFKHLTGLSPSEFQKS